MNPAEKIGEILLYFLPALVVLLAVYMLIKKFLDNSYKLRLLEAKRAIQKEVLPLRLNAYERICLLLERISPNNLLVRTNRSGMSARELQTELLAAIRAEYEHNLSQQVYVSQRSWDATKNAKEDIVRLINSAAASAGQDATSMQLSKIILEIMLKNETTPIQRALELIKAEAREIL